MNIAVPAIYFMSALWLSQILVIFYFAIFFMIFWAVLWAIAFAMRVLIKMLYS